MTCHSWLRVQYTGLPQVGSCGLVIGFKNQRKKEGRYIAFGPRCSPIAVQSAAHPFVQGAVRGCCKKIQTASSCQLRVQLPGLTDSRRKLTRVLLCFIFLQFFLASASLEFKHVACLNMGQSEALSSLTIDFDHDQIVVLCCCGGLDVLRTCDGSDGHDACIPAVPLVDFLCQSWTCPEAKMKPTTNATRGDAKQVNVCVVQKIDRGQ